MSMAYPPAYWDDEDSYDDAYEDYSDDPCDNCGPHCSHWGGDNLCMLVIEQQAQNAEDYEHNHVSTLQCPVCKKELTCCEIPHDKLWVWPGNFYDPMVGLGVYGAYSHPDKEELHESSIRRGKGKICHIRIGNHEKLIRLTGKES